MTRRGGRPGDRAGRGGRLEAHGLQKTYGMRQVVKDVHLAVASGEVVGLLGPNGAGKTTSFYMIVGLVRADAGEISIQGQRVERMPIHRRSRLGLSYLPQEASIFRKLTVEENIRAVLELQYGPDGKPLPKQRIDELLAGLLHDLGLEKLHDTLAPALSGGERRRVEIARALATQPRFILLDEPFAGVDPIAVIEIQRIIMFLQEPRHRRADHRPQRARDAGHLRPRLHHQRRPGAGRGHARRDRRQRRCAQGLPRRTFPDVGGRREFCDEAVPAGPPVPAPGADAAAAAVDPAAAAVDARAAPGSRADARAEPVSRARG